MGERQVWNKIISDDSFVQMEEEYVPSSSSSNTSGSKSQEGTLCKTMPKMINISNYLK